ncbi:MAG: CPBP family intramembrane glutamic endopeptidase [Planctomycetota bacterium]|nr:CPBP family intramembrane glutamic endopeptidase [Planctomycetota bacterium]
MPEISIPLAIEYAIYAVAIAGSLFAWILLGRWYSRTGQILPFEPRRAVPWTAIDLVLILMAQLLLGLLVMRIMQQRFDISGVPEIANLARPELLTLLWLSIGASILTVLFAVALVALRCNADRDDLGLNTKELRADLRRGVIAFVLIATLVYALQAGLFHLYPTPHPFIDLLRKQPDNELFLVIFVSVVIVAPICEEILFRVLLQGWLESAMSETSIRQPAAVDGAEMAAETDETERRPQPTGRLRPINSTNPYAASQVNAAINPAAYIVQPLELSRRFAPVLISSIVFALAHFGHGPAPIPLFFLACALGYLYQQTHRIWPSLVVHTLLNLCSLAILWAEL